jgi:Ca2+-binding EF-hand superfamily protein
MMIRSLYASFYATLVRLHPRAFRQRFGEEMLSIFDQTSRDRRAGGSRAALVGDAVFSLLRQWFLRPGLRAPENAAPECAAEVPMFLVLEDDPRLSPDRWMGGMALSLLSFAAASFLISHGGNPSAFSAGSRMSGQSGVPVQSGASESSPDTEVTVNPELDPRDRGLVAAYFHAMPVLETLDVNHDLILSADEIANAPEALESLDRNGDGMLDVAECLPKFAQQFKTPQTNEGFMRMHPVLATLDADHDGVISASEIRNAPAALQSLDQNHDGRLTGGELLPENVLKLMKGGS